jgi:hypothetical protein
VVKLLNIQVALEQHNSVTEIMAKSVINLVKPTAAAKRNKRASGFYRKSLTPALFQVFKKNSPGRGSERGIFRLISLYFLNADPY